MYKSHFTSYEHYFYITENTHNFICSEIIQESIKLRLEGKCSELILFIQSLQWYSDAMQMQFYSCVLLTKCIPNLSN